MHSSYHEQIGVRVKKLDYNRIVNERTLRKWFLFIRLHILMFADMTNEFHALPPAYRLSSQQTDCLHRVTLTDRILCCNVDLLSVVASQVITMLVLTFYEHLCVRNSKLLVSERRRKEREKPRLRSDYCSATHHRSSHALNLT
eukprot:scaffold10908_cov75-Skeletonema_marinoi.AAC.1